MEKVAAQTRRGFLKRAALAAGAVAGAKVLADVGRVDAAAVPPRADFGQVEFTLKGQNWHTYAQNRKRGDMLQRGDQLTVFGELLSDKGGDKTGEFYASALHIRAPFGMSAVAASNIEVHTFNLKDGTILGMGTTRVGINVESAYAVLGGTGKYANIKGTYTSRQSPHEIGGDGSAQFTFKVTL